MVLDSGRSYRVDPEIRPPSNRSVPPFLLRPQKVRLCLEPSRTEPAFSGNDLQRKATATQPFLKLRPKSLLNLSLLVSLRIIVANFPPFPKVLITVGLSSAFGGSHYYHTQNGDRATIYVDHPTQPIIPIVKAKYGIERSFKCMSVPLVSVFRKCPKQRLL